MRMELGFIDDVLTRMVFFDNLDQTTLVEFNTLAVNTPIGQERFEFLVPDGVDVVGTPAVADALAN